MQIYEWDNEKNKLNIAKHGIDFTDAKEIWQSPVVEFASNQNQHNEQRVLAIGLIQGYCITVIYTWRGTAKRLISARKARKDERENYQNAIR